MGEGCGDILQEEDRDIEKLTRSPKEWFKVILSLGP